jgi:hypothetical protein
MSETAGFLLTVIPPIIIGGICGYFLKGWLGAILAVFISFLVFVGVILFMIFVLPNKGGGAAFFPILITIGGTIVAGVGIVSYGIARLIFKKLLKTTNNL